MSRLVCLLHAVNVGGRRVTNDVLVGAAEEAGLGPALAYQAAGNLVVEAGDRSALEVAGLLEDAVEAAAGFRAAVVTRTGEELRAATASAPWTQEQVRSAVGKPQVVLCRDRPDRATAAAVLALATDDDLLHLSGRDLHWLPMTGTGRSALDTRSMAELLRPATARTIGTLDRIRSKHLPD